MMGRKPVKLKRGDKCSWRGIPILIEVHMILIEVTMTLVSMLNTTRMPPFILKMLLRPTAFKLRVVLSIHLLSMQDTMRGEEKERQRGCE